MKNLTDKQTAIVNVMNSVISNRNANDKKKDLLLRVLELYRANPSEDNFNLFKKVVATQTGIMSAQSYVNFVQAVNPQLDDSQKLNSSPSEQFKNIDEAGKAVKEAEKEAAEAEKEAAEAEKEAAEKEAAETAAETATEAAIKIQKVVRGFSVRKAAAIELQLEDLMFKVQDILPETVLLLKDYASFLEKLDLSDIPKGLDLFIEEKIQRILKSISIGSVDLKTTFGKSLYENLSGTILDLNPKAQNTPINQLAKMYSVECLTLSSESKGAYVEAMKSAVKKWDINKDNVTNLKNDILQKIVTEFEKSNNPVEQSYLIELFKKVAGAHRNWGSSMFITTPNTLRIFEKKLAKKLENLSKSVDKNPDDDKNSGTGHRVG